MRAARILVEEPSAEPIGIVISRGKRDAPEPRLSAYVWGPAPSDLTPEESKAA